MRFPWAALALSLSLGLSGCYGTLAKRTAAFADQAAPALVSTRCVYTLVAQVEDRRARTEAIARYGAGESYTAIPLKLQFGTEADNRERDAVLHLLASYIDALAEAAGDQHLKELAPASQAAGKALAAAAKAHLPELVKSTSGASTASAGTGSAASTLASAAAGVSSDDLARAVDAIGQVLAQRMRARSLPGILQAADGPVTALTGLLRRDFAVFRPVLAADYVELETASDTAIQGGTYSTPEKHAAIDALFTLVEEARTTQTTLDGADHALDELARTHHALAESAREKDAADFHSRLAELIAEGRELAALESQPAESAAGAKVAANPGCPAAAVAAAQP